MAVETLWRGPVFCSGILLGHVISAIYFCSEKQFVFMMVNTECTTVDGKGGKRVMLGVLTRAQQRVQRKL